MAYLNRVEQIGVVVGDIVLRPAGETQICTFRIGNQRLGPEGVDRKMYVDVETWGKLAVLCRDNLHELSNVLVEGELKMDKWVDKEGKNRHKHVISAEKVQFLDNIKRRPLPDTSNQ